MEGTPNRANFFASLHTHMSRQWVSQLFTPLGWRVRNCSFTGYEVRSSWAELVIDAESPILLHGSVADVQENAERILALLQAAGVAYDAESYDASGELMREYHWPKASRLGMRG